MDIAIVSVILAHSIAHFEPANLVEDASLYKGKNSWLDIGPGLPLLRVYRMYMFCSKCIDTLYHILYYYKYEFLNLIMF